MSAQFNPVFSGLATTIFTVMSALAAKYSAINLGQGFPDVDGPIAIREAAAKGLRDGPNQYPPMRGRIELRRAITAHARRFYGFDLDPETDVIVTSGATEALAASIMGLAGRGGEVVLIEPAYDSYQPIAASVGATVRYVRLEPPHWRLTEEALRKVVSDRTQAIVVNSPLNPIGRVFDREELEGLARVVSDSRAVVISDEVYEHLTFDGRPHVSLAALRAMRERVVRIGSAGKMFSLTGWKVGWIAGCAELIQVVANAHQFLTFTTSPALQLGIAHALEHEMDFTMGLTRELEQNRDLLADGIARLGFEVLPCEGTYFLTADIRRLTNDRDRIFCERLVREAGVALIPLSVFFTEGKPDTLVRFAFCKQRAVIEEALARLQKHFG